MIFTPCPQVSHARRVSPEIAPLVWIIPFHQEREDVQVSETLWEDGYSDSLFSTFINIKLDMKYKKFK